MQKVHLVPTRENDGTSFSLGTKQADSLISSCLHSKQNQDIVIKSFLEIFTRYANYRFSIIFFRVSNVLI